MKNSRSSLVKFPPVLAPTLQDASKDIVRSLRLHPTRASNYYANCLSRDVQIVAEQ